MKKAKKWITVLLAVMMIAAMLSGCSNNSNIEDNSPPPSETSDNKGQSNTSTDSGVQGLPAEGDDDTYAGDVPFEENVRIRVAGLLNANLAVWYTGLEEGFFLDRGIEVEFLTVASGNEAATALASGDVDFAFAAMNNFQAAVASGNDQSVFIGVTTGNGGEEWYCSHMALVVHPDSHVKSEDDLKGAVIGTQLGGTSELYARNYLLDIGLDPDNDVEWVNINNADQLTAFINGDVDIISSSEPYNTEFQIEVPGAWELVRGGPYYTYASGVMTTRDYYKNHPDVVQKVMTAFAQAAWSTRNDTHNAAEILSHWIPGSDVEVNAESMKHVGYDPRLTVNTELAWEDGLTTQLESGKLTERIEMRDYCDATYMNEVVEVHPEWFADLNDAELLPYNVMG